MEFAGIRMRFQWNPFMQFDGEYQATARELETYRKERRKPKPVKDQKSAAMIMFGTGPWFGAKYNAADSLSNFTEAYVNLTKVVKQSDITPIASQPLGEDGIGSQMFFAPPLPPHYIKGNVRVKKGDGVKYNEIQPLQDFLVETEEAYGIPILKSWPALVRGQNGTIVDPLQTGFHVIDSVAEVKASILLNARCNAKLDRLKGYPYDRTCCTDYGGVPLTQLVVLGICFAYLAICVLNELRSLRSAEKLDTGIFNLEIGIFAAALLACYWADRTQAFAKGSKEFVSSEFIFMCFLVVLTVVFSIAKSPPPRPRPGQAEQAIVVNDAKPLSRDQTDEWKGWMQAIILIYHWTGASKILPIYIGVRLLVAAYLFQTGFGHAVYFVTKKDFSFKRVAAVLLRLNLLSCALPYVMRTDYMFYYFAPLVTFWFLIVYATFAIGSKYNDRPAALFAKIGIAAFICPGLMIWTPILDLVFMVLNFVFRIQWDLHEWQFRLGLDGVIVYIGILVGVASVQTKWYNLLLTGTKGVLGIVGASAMFCYWFAATFIFGEKQQYNFYHTYVSFIPILGFIALRNINAPARLSYSRSMAWLGRCSLETFTLQFHIFLAADTKGLLLLGLFKGGDGSLLWDRWRDLVVIVPLFLWFSTRVAEATNGLVKVMTAPATQGDKPALAEGTDLDLESKGDLPTKGGRTWLNFGVSDLRIRIAGFLVLMWILNLVSHGSPENNHIYVFGHDTNSLAAILNCYCQRNHGLRFSSKPTQCCMDHDSHFSDAITLQGVKNFELTTLSYSIRPTLFVLAASVTPRSWRPRPR